MSANGDAVHVEVLPDHHESGHGTLGGYAMGFFLSVVLTAIPFWVVGGNVFRDSMVAATAVMILAGIQVVVHMVYFLHMNTRSEGGWTFMALVFTAVLVVITLAGSLWVMHHLNTNMMPPMTAEAASAMP